MGEDQQLLLDASACAPWVTSAVGVVEATRLRAQLVEAWSEIKALRRTVAHQARLLSTLAAETHPAAPSLNACYWLFSLANEHTPSWPTHRNRLLPSLRGLGTLPAPEVTPLAWARHLAARRHEQQRGGGTPCAHTTNIELGRLKGLLDWSVANQMIAFNPLTSAGYEKTTSRRETDLRPADIDRLLEEAAQLRDRRREDYDDDGSRAAMLRAFVLCCFDSMLRFNEARHLRRDMIEVDGSYPVARAHTKTDAGARTIVLTPRTLDAIRAVPVHPATHLVFINLAKGTLIGEGTLRTWFRWAVEKGRLDARAALRDGRIVVHHLRHAGATAADAAGVRPGALQVTLGHTTTRHMERYLHRDGVESARHVAEIMAGVARAVRRGPRKAMGGGPEKVRGRAKSR